MTLAEHAAGTEVRHPKVLRGRGQGHFQYLRRVQLQNGDEQLQERISPPHRHQTPSSRPTAPA